MEHTMKAYKEIGCKHVFILQPEIIIWSYVVSFTLRSALLYEARTWDRGPYWIMLTSVNPGSTPRHIPEDDILHSHRCQNLKSYNLLEGSRVSPACPSDKRRVKMKTLEWLDGLH
jgi:hypothetical protein